MKTGPESANVQVGDPEWHTAIGDLPALCNEIFRAVSAVTEAPIGEVGLLFCNDDAIRRLNATYRGKDKPTNVLSFPAGPGPAQPGQPTFLGDIAVARETVLAEASEQKKTVRDHTAHMIVHGLLHLLGHDHEEPREADVMENLERRILESLRIENPYLLRVAEPT